MSQVNWDDFQPLSGATPAKANTQDNLQPAPSEPDAVDWSQFEPVKEAGIARKVGDLGLSLAKGAVAVPEAAVGLADIATGGRAGKVLENEGGALGFRPQQARGVLSSFQSDDLQAKQQQFQQAEGVIDKFGVALSNPSLITNSVAESLPLMGAGGIAGRAAVAAAPRAFAAIPNAAPVVAGAVGEGVAGAGSAGEQFRQETKDGLLTPAQSGLAALSGVADTAFGALGGKVAQSLGVGHAGTLLASGLDKVTAANARKTAKSIPRKIVEGALSEGLLEELPQSVAEQLLQNMALDKPWDDGLDDAAVMGVLAGAAMGGAAAPIHGGHAHADAKDQPGLPVPSPAATAPAVPPVPAVPGTTEGTLAPVAAVSPSAAMGLDPGAGPLSAAATVAVDTGAHEAVVKGQLEEAAVAAANATPIDTAHVNPDTGEIVSAFDQREADRPRRQPDDIVGAEGQPFTNPFAARRAAKEAGEGFAPIKLGEREFVVRPTNAVASQGPPDGWSAFAPGTGTKGVPRTDMPQIKAVHRGALANFLKARGIESQQEEVRADSLKPTQAEFSLQKVERAAKFADSDRAILVSSDHHVLDGHHQWLARLKNDEPVKVIRLNAPIDQLLREVQEFPSAGRSDASGQPSPQQGAHAHAALSTPQGVPHGPQANQTQQAATPPAQAGTAAPAVTAPAPAQRIEQSGERWASMTEAERKAVAERTDIKPVLRKNLPRAQWENLNADVQAKLAEQVERSTDGNLTSTPEQQRQAFTEAEARRTASGRRLRAAAYAANPFRAFLGQHGVALDQAREFAPGKTERNSAMVPGYGPIFRKSGKALDLLAQNAVEEGFLTDPDVAKLHAMIADALRGGRIIAQYAEGVAEQEMQAQMDARAQFEQDAEPAQNAEVEADTQAEREAIQNVQMLDDATAFDLADELTASSNTSTAEFLRAMGASEQEIENEIAKERTSAQEGHQGRGEPDETAAHQAPGDSRERAETPRIGPADEGLSVASAPFEPQQQEFDGNGQRWRITVDRYWKVPVAKRYEPDMLSWSAEKQKRHSDGTPYWEPARGDDVPKAVAKKASAFFENVSNATSADLLTAPKIEDFGEKLEGARKDYATLLRDAASVDARSEPLSRSWPEPDYRKLLDGGADPFVVAWAHAARDEVPTKPVRAWKLAGWVKSVELLRGTTARLLDGSIDKQKLLTLLNQEEFTNLRLHVRGRADLYQAVGHEKSLKGISLDTHSYTLYKGVEYKPAKTLWAVQQQAKATAFSNFPREIVTADSREQAIAAFKAKYAELDLGAKAKGKSTFILYRKRGQEGTYIGKKIGREYVDLHKAIDQKAARAYLADHQEDLEKALARYKATPYERGEENAPRVGGDHRHGAAMTPENFADAFGFRGVQFGNYVEQGRRQSDLNEAFDALMDMAGVLGLPPRALSLAGRLGLAFGARGKGGKNAPAAHYEPGNVVINLTKGGGPGSLAHEWFHGMDNYFSKEGGGAGFMTAGARGDTLRPELNRAFQAIRRTLNLSGLKARSQDLDGRRSKPYWSTPEEMAARAFESYVIAKLQDQGASNDYLANVVSGDAWNALEALQRGDFSNEKVNTYPYPTVDEMPAVRAAFDDFFKTVETSTSENGNVRLREPGAAYTGAYETDLFGEPVPPPPGKDRAPKSPRTGLPGDVHTASALQDTPAPRGEYFVNTIAGSQTRRELGTAIVATPAQAAQATRYLYKSAVERFDGIVTDAAGKPLAVVGGFKGAVTQTSIYPGTVVAEAIRIPGAARIWFSHNHPSGTPVLSRADETLNASMTAIFKGSGIEPMGLLAIGSGRFSHVSASGTVAEPAEIPDAIVRKQVPVMERELGDGRPEPAISSPADAKALGKAFYNKAHEPGIVLLNAQNQPAGWLPLTPPMLGPLRGTGGLNALYRAASQSNAGAAILVHAGELDVRVPGGSVTLGQNIAAALKNVDVRPLDSINVATGKSLAEAGLHDLASGPVFSRDGKASGAAPIGEIEQAVRAITSKWANAPKVVVAQTLQDESIAGHVRDHEARMRSQGAGGEPEGIFYGGTVYLLADQIASPQDAARVLFHEVLGHAGLRGAFGESLTPILRQMVTMRRKAVAAKAREYGLDMSREADRLQAAEEVLAEMAQSTAELGFVKRAIAAIRTWLRENLPAFKHMALTDSEIVRSYLLPARGFIERGRQSGVASLGDAPEIRFSRAAAGTMASNAVAKVNEYLSAPGKVSWWHKSFGTMYNLAERSPAFKPVFEAAQNFINDVSYYATEAADLAPRILPKLETWKDIGKKPIAAADNQAISAPIFEGTLSWARDADGQVVRVEALQDRYKGLSDEDKARLLKPGVVFTDAELRSHFNLTPGQMGLYREFHAAAGQSLDSMAKADMLRYGGGDVAPLRDAVMEAASVDEAASLLRDYLKTLAKEDVGRADVLNDTAAGMAERADKVNALKAEGYAPLSRFGKYSVDVLEGGERQYFGLFETMHDANRMARVMRAEFGQGAVTQGTLSNEAFKMFAGLTPETLELFGNALGLDSTGDQARDQVFQDFLKLTKNNRSAMKRLIHRQGIAGYSEDAGRVLASFVYSNARQTAAALHMGDLGRAVADIPKQQGELTDVAMKLADYIKNPQEEAQAVRGLLFAQYLGGSVASALVNMTQPIAVSFPYLSQFGGIAQAGKALTRAYTDLAKKVPFEAELAKALKHAEENGIVSPQEVHQLMAQARGAGSLRVGDGTRAGNAMASAGNAMSRLSMAWGKVFGVAEQLNRRSTFIAAFRIAKAQGIANPMAFAETAVNQTQFIYHKANKMQFGRGAIGGTLMTFKSYTISYLELLHRMYTQGGPEGKKAALLGIGVLFLMGGAGGLPFAEDAQNLADAALQRLGYNVSTQKAKEEFLQGIFGEAGAEFVDRGLSGLPGVPIDVSGRLGLGNVIPGTGLFQQRTDHTSDLLEVAGPMGDFVKRLGQGGGLLLGGDFKNAALTAAPNAVRNMARGVDMAATGLYRDARGYKVLDTNPLEAAFKAIGFQPASVAEVQGANSIHQQAKNFYNLTAGNLRAQWAQGIFEGDPAKVERARAGVARWNRRNPDQPMAISVPSVMHKVVEMRKSKEQRIADTAPKAMRVQMREELARAHAGL